MLYPAELRGLAHIFPDHGDGRGDPAGVSAANVTSDMSESRASKRLWTALRAVISLHTLVYRVSGGRVGQTVRGTPPMLLLEHRGARSGKVRTTPLGYIRDGDDLVVVASKGGHPRNPSWFHNLMAHPDVRVQVGSTRARVRAREAQPDERARLWPAVVAAYAGYDSYQARTDRLIPLVILEPRGDEGADADAAVR
jgi:deazaflavin-dependent oxidoreductase (nitroreductase family)